MASLPSDSVKTRMSFAKVRSPQASTSQLQNSALTHAKVAASAMNTTTATATQLPENTTHNSNNQHYVESAQNAGLPTSQPATLMDSTVKPKRLIQIASGEIQIPEITGSNNAQPVSQGAERPLSRNSGAFAPSCSPIPGIADGHAAQITSSDISGKPPSLDGKSVTSGTTFAMDEKESIRPDDSASVKASEDEESSAVGSRLGSDTGARAFRDQLREISSIGPSLRPSGPMLKLSPAVSTPGSLSYGTQTLPGGNDTSNPELDLPENMNEAAGFAPDEKLIEALNNPRDRIWVLKLEQDILDFIKDPKEHAYDVPQCNSFYRMLAHKLADYYLLGHVVDSMVSSVRLYKTPNLRTPPPLTGITNPSTAANTPPPTGPAMKILRRGGEPPMAGKLGSEADGDSGSDGGRKSQGPLTREEREARYEAARLRILGSARPAEEAEAPKLKDESRSSSAAGKKKNGKKQRSNSDDGFDLRSAYSTYPNGTTVANVPSGENANTQFYSPYNNGMPTFGQQNTFANPATYNAAYGQALAPDMSAYPWLQPQYPNYQDQNSQSWDQHQQGYDLSSDFQSMSLQQQGYPGPNVTMNAPQNTGYYGGAHQNQQLPQAWSQQGQMQSPYQASASTQSQSPYDRSNSVQSQGQYQQPYPYGVLPSQIGMTGKRMGNPNHPIPGSFNRNGSFNPQSQSFIPGQPSVNSQRNFGSPVPSPNPNGYGGPQMSYQMQRQGSSQSQASSYSSPLPDRPQPQVQNMNVLRGSNQGMTHPLPQPVFSPYVPLPQSRPSNGMQNSPGNQASSIAKWGTPASLPAKPPPPAGSFDMSKLQPSSRLPAFNPAMTSRLPTAPNGGPFNGLPQMSRSGQ